VIARWFVYLLALTAASEVLGVERLSAFLQQVVAYLPDLAAGIVIILVGFVVGDFLGDLVIETAEKGGIEWGNLFGNLFKVMVYFVVFLVGLRQMRIDVTLLEALVKYLAVGAAVGSAVGSLTSAGSALAVFGGGPAASAFLAASGVGAVALGIPERSRIARVSGLALLITGILKALVHDLVELGLLSRGLSLLAVGAALIGISYLYARYQDVILGEGTRGR